MAAPGEDIEITWLTTLAMEAPGPGRGPPLTNSISCCISLILGRMFSHVVVLIVCVVTEGVGAVLPFSEHPLSS